MQRYMSDTQTTDTLKQVDVCWMSYAGVRDTSSQWGINYHGDIISDICTMHWEINYIHLQSGRTLFPWLQQPGNHRIGVTAAYRQVYD